MQRLIQIQLNASGDEVAQAIATASAHDCTGIEVVLDTRGDRARQEFDGNNSHAISHVLEQLEQAGLPSCEAFCLARSRGGWLECSAMESIIETAARLGARRVSISPATVGESDSDHVSYQDALNRTFDALLAVVPRLERCGVTLALRAARHGFLMSPPELRELIGRLNSHAVGADIDCTGRDDRASALDWLATLGNGTCAMGVAALENRDWEFAESAFQRLAPAARPSAHLILRPGPATRLQASGLRTGRGGLEP